MRLPKVRAPKGREPHRTALEAGRGGPCSSVPTGDAGGGSPWGIVSSPRGIRGTAESPLDDDDPERSSVQRMAASPAQGQEDVPASAGAAVGRGPLHDLAADPW